VRVRILRVIRINLCSINIASRPVALERAGILTEKLSLVGTEKLCKPRDFKPSKIQKFQETRVSWVRYLFSPTYITAIKYSGTRGTAKS